MSISRFAKRSICAAVMAVVFIPLFAHAQLGGAEYIRDFSSIIAIQKDSTVRVEEHIQYDFAGSDKHGIFREIPYDYTTADGRSQKLDITAVNVIDENGTAYPYSLSNENGMLRIKIGDANALVSGEKTYIISYVVHNALTPYDSFDELYWNVTGDRWQVPIQNASTKILLPSLVSSNELRVACYRGIAGSKSSCTTTVNGNDSGVTSILFVGAMLHPSEGLTAAVGFPKNTVVFPSAWQEFVRKFLLTLIAAAVLVCAIIFALFISAKDALQNDGTIIAEYEPPQGLRPAEADVLVHGKAGLRTWPATVVDLAVRGYIKIEEDGSKKIMSPALVFGALGFFAIGVTVYFLVTDPQIIDAAIVGIFSFFIAVFIGTALRQGIPTMDYVLSRSDPKNATLLEAYEQKFLGTLFESGVLSTKALRTDIARSRKLRIGMIAIEKDLYTETATETKAYILDPETAKSRMGVCFLLVVVIFFILKLFAGGLIPSSFIFLHADATVALIELVIALFIAAYPFALRPRFNKEGSEERRQWLGFKLYLETAERYRLQNLTPETFEKYLPYAMIFEIEKKWAQTFQGLNVQAPTWYVGNSSGANFSPASFSSNFATSFSSSFASSGGSGGGGGAGGGGGGGGGGSW